MSYKRALSVLFVLSFLLQTLFAATCGNGKSEGNEECDGADLRGYYCYTLKNYPGHQSHYFTDGELSCASNCKFDYSGCYTPLCGDGVVNGLEECDDGSANSDSAPNACRTNCVRAKCGDYGVDSGEECDDFPYNSDEMPGACRTDCKLAHCGDGVVDHDLGEKCDSEDDGCTNCQECYAPVDNLHVTKDMKLCPGNYALSDNGEEGVIIIDSYGVTLDCSGATLEGEEFGIGAPTINQAAQQIMQQGAQPSGPGNLVQHGKSIGSSGNNSSQGGAAPSGGSPGSPYGQVASIKAGTGINILGENALLINCHVTNFRNGVKIASSGSALVKNTLCGNTMDIRAESQSNYGAINMCGSSAQWSESGATGCTFDCSGQKVENPCVLSEAPACQCEECPACDSSQGQQDDAPPAPPAQPSQGGIIEAISGFFGSLFGGQKQAAAAAAPAKAAESCSPDKARLESLYREKSKGFSSDVKKALGDEVVVAYIGGKPIYAEFKAGELAKIDYGEHKAATFKIYATCDDYNGLLAGNSDKALKNARIEPVGLASQAKLAVISALLEK